MSDERKVRASYTLQFKMGVVEWVESTGASVRAAAKKFSIDRKMIRNWLSNKDHMKSALLARGPGMRKLHDGRSPVSEELDKQVLEHYLNEHGCGRLLGNKEIKDVALKYGRLLGLKGFKATSSWVTCWRSRCELEPDRFRMGIEYGNETVATLLHIASSLLSRVKPSEAINLSCRQMHQSAACHESCDLTDVYFDYNTPEHNYCKPPSTECHMTTPQSSQDGLLPPMTFDLSQDSFAEPIIECEVAEIDIPTYSDDIVIIQDSDLKGSDLNGRSTSPPFFPSLLEDDPHSLGGGLLASRLLQPVFPNEPEIVYLDMQLGMLHSIH